MSERRARTWAWWAGKGALAMGTLAALALAVTVLFAQSALNDAADVVIRGDGDTLVSTVIVDLWEADSLTAQALTGGAREARGSAAPVRRPRRPARSPCGRGGGRGDYRRDLVHAG